MNRSLAPPATLLAVIIMLSFAGSPLSSAQVENVLVRFNATTDGGKPVGGLIADSANNLYGTTIWNSYLSNACLTTGSDDCGTVFQLSPGQFDGGPWIETLLYRFSGGPDGSFPTGPLARDQAGNLYGTTTQGGDANNDGTIFELSPPIVPGDPWTKTTLHVFAGIDGSGPHGLIMDGTGNLFGTASEGGCNFGTVFELSPGGSGTWTFQAIYVLGCGSHFQDEGLFPGAAPIRGPGGDLYGTTPYGGQFSAGTIYKLIQPTPTHPAWRFKVIYSLQDTPDGAHSEAPLTAFQGNLYGTAFEGGTCTVLPLGCGIVFRLSPPSYPGVDWSKTTIYEFQGAADGSAPLSAVSFDKQGRLYGTTNSGGNPSCKSVFHNGCGAVYQLSPPANIQDPWTETTLHGFLNAGDGGFPGPVIVGNAGALYGTTYSGGDMTCSLDGTKGCGTVFKLVP
jgi:uncharacterized repeat protein (TIGR03803 family)